LLLEAEPDLTVAGEAADGSQALDQARRLDPDVILMDVRMPGMNGIEATARLVQAGSRARIPAPRVPGAPVAGAAGGLTERELGVVRLVAQGLSNAEIAARLYLSEATVKSHIARILAKLAVRDRVQVAVYAYEQGIVRPGRGT